MGNNQRHQQVPFPDSSDPKAQLRTTMRRLLRDHAVVSDASLATLHDWLCRHDGLRTITTFAALPGEVDLTQIIALHPGRCWVWPRVVGDDLHFHQVTDPEADLKPGTLGVREPSPELPRVPLEEIDAFLCPGLAFDSCGGRLGRGRGYYDRVLASARPDAAKIGVCFPWQLVADTFPEAHDVMMDEVFSAIPPPDAHE